MLIIVKIFEKCRFELKLQISWFWSKLSKIFDFSHCLWKFRFWSIFMEISIMVQVDDNLNFCQLFRKISFLINILGIIELGQNFPQLLNLVKISEKCRFGSNMKICRSWSKFIKNLETSQNFKKISILVKIVGNSRFYQCVDFGKNCI